MAKRARKPKTPAKPLAKSRPGDYEKFKASQAAIARERSAAGRDIGEIPECADQARRESCRINFRLFCETYHPETFSLAWSPDHLKAIARIETVILQGEQYAIAMPRGSGKTSLCDVACEWAILYGHRRYLAMIGPEEEHAKSRIEVVRGDFENNALYQADFPEVCYPLAALEGIPQRRLLYRGRNIRMRFTASRVIFARCDRVTGEISTAGIVHASSLTGQIRGMQFKTTEGLVLRPDAVILDDPQKDDLANSPSQVDKLERIVNGSVLGLSGPKVSIAAICPCTVIAKDDLADRLLDRTKNPSWQGERTKLVYSFPSNEKLWDEYRELRDRVMRDQGKAAGTEAANAFYRASREAMDAGAAVAWPERYSGDEVSAIQHAMNIRYDRGDRAFFAEFQNEPIPDTPVDSMLLPADVIAKRVNGLIQGQVPTEATRLTAYIDVQEEALYYVVAAWTEGFTGYIVDYGTFPDQQLGYFALKDVRRTLTLEFPSSGGIEGRWHKGLTKLTDWMLREDWYHEDGTPKRVDRCLIDANYGKSTDTVYAFCRQSEFASLLLPSHGKGVGPAQIPFSEYRRRPGERFGLNWRIGFGAGRRQRSVLLDTNFWKSFVHERLRVEYPEPTSLSLFGRMEIRGKRTRAADHRMFAEHMTAEFRTRLSGTYREVDVWSEKPHHPDNHWFDCTVGAAVAASIEGVKLPGESSGPRRTEKPKVYKW